MKKARKLGLQSLALVLMAFVLVAGVAFGMTGAWFQDKALPEATQISMGKAVKIAFSGLNLANGGEGATLDNLMPGDTIKTNAAVTITANDTEGVSAMYLFVKLTVNLGQTGITNDACQLAAGDEDDIGGYKVYAVDAAANGAVLKEIWANNTTLFTVPVSLTNTVANEQGSVTIRIVALQQANVDLSNLTEAKLDAVTAQSGLSDTANFGA